MRRYDESVLKAVFARKGGDLSASEAFLAENLESRFGFHLLENEVPILCERMDVGWVLLTEFRLIVWNEVRTESIRLENVERVSVDLQVGTGAGASRKEQLNTLKLECSEGGEVQLRLNPGGNFGGWLSVFMWIMRRNSASPINSDGD